MTQTFEATLNPRGPKGAWTHLDVPFNVEGTFGSKAACKVAGAINGFPFRTSLMPNGDGTHHLVVTKAMMAGANAAQNDLVSLTLAPDTALRTVATPPGLEQALTPALRATFDHLAYTHRKEFVVWIEAAKRPETRSRRIEKTLELLAAKQHLTR